MLHSSSFSWLPLLASQSCCWSHQRREKSLLALLKIWNQAQAREEDRQQDWQISEDDL